MVHGCRESLDDTSYMIHEQEIYHTAIWVRGDNTKREKTFQTIRPSSNLVSSPHMVAQAMSMSVQLNAREVLHWQTIDCIMMQNLCKNKL